MPESEHEIVEECLPTALSNAVAERSLYHFLGRVGVRVVRVLCVGKPDGVG